MKPGVFDDRRWMAAILVVFGVLCTLPPRARAELLSSVTFDNKSGNEALVKLVGPFVQALAVPDGQSRTVKTPAGRYRILVRYGSPPERYSYAKGAPFDVEERETATGTEYSKITITLHLVVGGNYSTGPSSKDEFEKAAGEVMPSPANVGEFRPNLLKAQVYSLDPNSLKVRMIDPNLLKMQVYSLDPVLLKVRILDPKLSNVRMIDPNLLKMRVYAVDPNFLKLRMVDPNLLKTRVYAVDPNLLKVRMIDPNSLKVRMIDPNLLKVRIDPNQFKVRLDPNQFKVRLDPNQSKVRLDPNQFKIRIDPNLPVTGGSALKSQIQSSSLP